VAVRGLLPKRPRPLERPVEEVGLRQRSCGTSAREFDPVGTCGLVHVEAIANPCLGLKSNPNAGLLCKDPSFKVGRRVGRRWRDGGPSC